MLRAGKHVTRYQMLLKLWSYKSAKFSAFLKCINQEYSQIWQAQFYTEQTSRWWNLIQTTSLPPTHYFTEFWCWNILENGHLKDKMWKKLYNGDKDKIDVTASELCSVTEPRMISQVTLTIFDHSVTTCITILLTSKHTKGV